MAKENERERVNIDLGSSTATQVPSRPGGTSRTIRAGSGDYLRGKLAGADSTKISAASYSRDIGERILAKTIRKEGRKYKSKSPRNRAAYVASLQDTYSRDVERENPSRPSEPVRPSPPGPMPIVPDRPTNVVNKKEQNGQSTVKKTLKA